MDPFIAVNLIFEEKEPSGVLAALVLDIKALMGKFSSCFETPSEEVTLLLTFLPLLVTVLLAASYHPSHYIHDDRAFRCQKASSSMYE
ncbi:hypothetical protein SLE2022_277400 [Rubroshorea leprosula]